MKSNTENKGKSLSASMQFTSPGVKIGKVKMASSSNAIAQPFTESEKKRLVNKNPNIKELLL